LSKQTKISLLIRISFSWTQPLGLAIRIPLSIFYLNLSQKFWKICCCLWRFQAFKILVNISTDRIIVLDYLKLQVWGVYWSLEKTFFNQIVVKANVPNQNYRVYFSKTLKLKFESKTQQIRISHDQVSVLKKLQTLLLKFSVNNSFIKENWK